VKLEEMWTEMGGRVWMRKRESDFTDLANFILSSTQ